MKTIESWVQDMKSQGAGFANALVVNLILAFITGTAILGFFLCAAKAYSRYIDEPIYSQNTSFIRHIKSALLCLLLGGLAGTLWAVLPKY